MKNIRPKDEFGNAALAQLRQVAGVFERCRGADRRRVESALEHTRNAIADLEANGFSDFKFDGPASGKYG